MKKILVAGAGHGGLSAAAILAKNGFDVLVLEKNKKEHIGHDWHDAMDLPAFWFADIPEPPEENFNRGLHMCYFNPKKTVKINTDSGPGTTSNCITIDRKYLLNYLVDYAKNCGVKFIFEATVLNAICENNRVLGLNVEIDGIEQKYFADMVIDAAGMNSPVRRNLPESFGIQKEIPKEDTFEIYRAYYENTQKYITDPNYSVYFYNCKKPGIDWVITDEEYIDVLIGKFGYITEDEIETSLNDINSIYPGMGKKIRGGQVAKIPLSKTLPLLVGNCYALIGDSASMTVPLNGSGINLSLQAGKLLASAIISAEKSGYKKEDLWQYQYRYFTLFGNSLIPIAILRRFMGSITAEDIDFFLEKKILTEKEIGMAGGDFSGIGISYILEKMAAAAPKIALLPSLIHTVKSIPKIAPVTKMMPSKWDSKKVEKWLRAYEEL